MTYRVVISVDNERKILMPGMTANVSVIVEKKKGDILKVASSALEVSSPQGRAAAPGRRGLSSLTLKRGTRHHPVKTGIYDVACTPISPARWRERGMVVVTSLPRRRRAPSAFGFGADPGEALMATGVDGLTWRASRRYTTSAMSRWRPPQGRQFFRGRGGVLSIMGASGSGGRR